MTPPFALRADHMALRVTGLCFLVLFLEGYDVSALGYATPSLIEAWHASAPQFTTVVTLGAFSMLMDHSAPVFWATAWAASRS
jgi:hypothetical protein